jgi:pentatricopeptide repeat protein
LLRFLLLDSLTVGSFPSSVSNTLYLPFVRCLSSPTQLSAAINTALGRKTAQLAKQQPSDVSKVIAQKVVSRSLRLLLHDQIAQGASTALKVGLLHGVHRSRLPCDAYLYRVVIDDLLTGPRAAEHVDAAVALLRECLQAPGAEPAVVVSVCNRVMTHHARSGDWAALQSVFDEMLAHGLPPTVVSFGLLMRAAAGLRDERRVVAILCDEMPRAGVVPDARSYGAVVAFLAAQHSYAAAMERARELVPAAIAASLAFNNAVLSGLRPSDAIAHFEHMAASGMQCDVQALDVLLRACADAGQPERGVRAFELMRARGVKPDAAAASAVVKLHCKLQAPEAAEALLREYDGAGAAAALKAIVLLHCERGDLVAARRVFDSSAAASGPGADSIRQCLLVHYCRAGDVKGAEQMFHSFAATGIDQWLPMMKLYVSVGEPELALRVYTTAVEGYDDRTRLIKFALELFRENDIACSVVLADLRRFYPKEAASRILLHVAERVKGEDAQASS